MGTVHNVNEKIGLYDRTLFQEYSMVALQGLLAKGEPVSYDTAHQSFVMAKMMMEIRGQYVN